MPKYFKISEDAINYLTKKDKRLGALISELGLIKREVNHNLFESIIDSIISQQISTKAALTVSNRFFSLVRPLTPENILSIDPLLIQKCGMSMRKVEYITSFARKVLTKELDLESLKDLSNDEVIKVLTKLKGIGVWTAEMLLIFSLERQDVISYLDLGIIRGMKRLYNLEEINKDTFNKYKKRYGKYASVASLYLWALGSK